MKGQKFHAGASRLPTHKTSPWGVVLLAHGSQRGNDTLMGLQEVVARLQALLGREQARVVLACLEFIRPDMSQAIHTLAADGFHRIVVMPYLLGQGKHATLELKKDIDNVRRELPEVELYCSAPLGCDPGLAKMVVERVLQVCSDPPQGNMLANPTHGTSILIGVLLVKAGTKPQYDDCLWLEEMGKMVAERLDNGYVVAVAQSHYGRPTMEEAAARLIEEHKARSLVCVPYIFFPGLILQRNIIAGTERLRQKYPGLPITVTSTLGVDDRLVAIAADRVREVWARLACHQSFLTSSESA